MHDQSTISKQPSPTAGTAPHAFKHKRQSKSTSGNQGEALDLAMFVQLRWSTFPTFVRDVGSKSTWVIVRKHTELARFQRCQGELKTSDTPAPTSLIERNHDNQSSIPFFHTSVRIQSCLELFWWERSAVVSHFFKMLKTFTESFRGWFWWFRLVAYCSISAHIPSSHSIPCNQSPSDWRKETSVKPARIKKTPTNNYLI